MSPNQKIALLLLGTVATLHFGFMAMKPALVVPQNEKKNERFNAFVKELEKK